jgi:hypothetical protein
MIKKNKIKKKIRTKSDRKKKNWKDALKLCMAMHINRVGERKDKKKLLIPIQRDVSQKCYPTMKRLSWKLKHYHENWYLTTKQRCLKNTNIATCVCVKKKY